MSPAYKLATIEKGRGSVKRILAKLEAGVGKQEMYKVTINRHKTMNLI
jgi:hypothetical protein